MKWWKNTELLVMVGMLPYAGTMGLNILFAMSWLCSMSTWNQFSLKSINSKHWYKIFFYVQLSDTLDKTCAQNELVYLMGDYDINLLNSSTYEHTGEFVDILYSNEFLLLISRPTHITSNAATLIDKIMTNCLDNLNSGSPVNDTSKLLLKLFQKPIGVKYTMLLTPRSLLNSPIPNW